MTELIRDSIEEAIIEIEEQHTIHQRWEFADKVVQIIKANMTKDIARQILSGNKTLTKCLIFMVECVSQDRDNNIITQHEKLIEKVDEFFFE